MPPLSAARQPDPVSAALQAEAARFSAEEAHREAKAAPPPPPEQAAEAADAKMTAQLLVTLIDLALSQLVAEKLKLSPAEQEVIAAKAEPVIRLYLPPELFLGPVGALATTVVMIYGAKFLAPDPVPAPSTETVDSTATEAKQ